MDAVWLTEGSYKESIGNAVDDNNNIRTAIAIEDKDDRRDGRLSTPICIETGGGWGSISWPLRALDLADTHPCVVGVAV
jgi:hypothetical protein